MTLPRSLHQEITNENARDTYLSTIKAKTNPEGWSTENGTWKYKEKTYIPEALHMQIISQNHNKPLAGHFGRDRTLDLICREYWWPNMSRYIAAYTRACQFCTQNKTKTHPRHGTLLPLPSPGKPWQRIGIDMITDLPKTKQTQYNTIFVVIDHFTKMSHFTPCQKTLTAEQAADLLVETIICYHGIPATIVSDRD